MYIENSTPEGVIPGTPAEVAPPPVRGVESGQSVGTIFQQQVDTYPVVIRAGADAQPRG